MNNIPALFSFGFCLKKDFEQKNNESAILETIIMAFFQSSITVLQTLVIAIGAGLGLWGGINLMEGYGNDNPGAKSQGIKHLMPNLMEVEKERISAVWARIRT